MGFFSDLFKPKAAEPSKLREPTGYAPPAVRPRTDSPSFRPLSAESRKKTSRLFQSVPDREIKLVLADVIQRIPQHFLKPGPHDLQRPLHFSIHDLFSDIARGRASVPLSKIAKLCPEVFRDKIDLVEDMEVHLPLQKLVGQVGFFPASGRVHAEKPLPAEPERAAEEQAARPEPEPVSHPAAPEKAEAAAAESRAKPPAFVQETISLPLAAIFRTMPKEAIIGDLETIGESVQLTLPCRLVEQQLAGGKVELSPNDFIDALPPDYRIHFARGASVMIPIPLEEILAAQSGGDSPARPKNETVKSDPAPTAIQQPSNSAEDVAPESHAEEPAPEPLPVAITEPPPPGPQHETAPEPSDQAAPPVEQEKPDIEQTPVRAPETAPATLHATLPPHASESVNEAAPSPFLRPRAIPPPRLFAQTPEPETPPAVLQARPSPPSPSFASLQEIFQTKEALNVHKIAPLICQLPGIAACVIVSEHSLLKGGAVPFDFDIEALRATFSELSQSLAGYGEKLHIGPSPNLALDCERFTVRFFAQPGACLCVFQNDRSLQPEVRDKLQRVIEELARAI